MLIMVGALAITARMLPMKEWVSVTLIAPQQLVLLVQLFGIIVALRRGAYPDGYIPVPGDWQASFWFILADQAAWILLCLSHALDMLFSNALRLTQSQYEARLEQEHNALLEAERKIAVYEEGPKWSNLVNDMKLRDREMIDQG
jgi:hypothetical protein